MDNISKEERSHVMSLVKQKNTRPELVVRSFLHRQGFRFRLHGKSLPGKPDIVLPKYRAVILVHGCFWHGHKAKSCKLSRIPKSHIEFWTNKISSNFTRDQANIGKLKTLGWKVLVIWECEIGNMEKLVSLVEQLRQMDITATHGKPGSRKTMLQ
ncbi:MAG TPA: very short patch repair endonuclease [Planctomycetaceae bacterium]|nr:very short patch repair endonuclease [Planctomycetaceae bacterium]